MLYGIAAVDQNSFSNDAVLNASEVKRIGINGIGRCEYAASRAGSGQTVEYALTSRRSLSSRP